MLSQCNWIYCLCLLNKVNTSIANQENIYITANQKTCTCWTYSSSYSKTAVSGSFPFYNPAPAQLPACCTATVIVNKDHKSTQWEKSRNVTETHCSCPMNRVLYGYEISPQNANSTWLSLNMLNSFLQHYTGSSTPITTWPHRLPWLSVGSR